MNHKYHYDLVTSPLFWSTTFLIFSEKDSVSSLFCTRAVMNAASLCQPTNTAPYLPPVQNLLMVGLGR
jgi:hypothetical protein